MSTFINTIDLIGDETATCKIIDKTITEFNDNVLTNIGAYAFINCVNLKNIDIPKVSDIGNSAFKGCTSLENLNFNQFIRFRGSTFSDCTSLKSVNLTTTRDITLHQYDFSGCTNLEIVNIPNLISSVSGAFHNTKITEANFPKMTKTGSTAFSGCSLLANVNLPLVAELGSSAFSNCVSLKNICLPALTSLSSGQQFIGCTSLECADLGKLSSLGYNDFKNCSSLRVVILRKDTAICSNSAISSFEGTPFASDGTGGILLIPSSLIESYKTATNWSVIWDYGHNQFLAIEDYTVDGTITGEIDWDKLNGGTAV